MPAGVVLPWVRNRSMPHQRGPGLPLGTAGDFLLPARSPRSAARGRTLQSGCARPRIEQNLTITGKPCCIAPWRCIHPNGPHSYPQLLWKTEKPPRAATGYVSSRRLKWIGTQARTRRAHLYTSPMFPAAAVSPQGDVRRAGPQIFGKRLIYQQYRQLCNFCAT